MVPSLTQKCDEKYIPHITQQWNKTCVKKILSLTADGLHVTNTKGKTIHRSAYQTLRKGVPVNCETKRNETKPNEIHRNQTKFTETKRN